MFTVVALTLVMPATFLISDSSQAVEPISLGAANSYAILAGGAFTNGATTSVLGDIAGTADPATQAMTDLGAAYGAAALVDTTVITASPTTFTPGAYHQVAALTYAANTKLTFDAGDVGENAVFLIRTDGALGIGADSTVTLLNGASADNIFWHVTGATTIGARSEFAGTMLTEGAITVGADATVRGRLLSTVGAVTLGASSKIYSYDPPPPPTLSSLITDLEAFNSYAILAGGAFTNGATTSVLGDIAGTADPATQAMTDLGAAYGAAALVDTTVITASPTTFTPGAYHQVAALTYAANTKLTFDAGDVGENAVFLIRTDGALGIGADSTVTLLNGASADNIFWHVTGATTIGARSEFAGTMLTEGAITVGADATVRGRLLSTVGAVTLGASSKIYSYDAIARAQAVQDALDAAAAQDALDAAAAQDALDAATAADLAAKAKAAKAAEDAKTAADLAAKAKAAKAAEDAKTAADLAAKAAEAAEAAATTVKQAAEAEEVRVYGPKVVMTFAPTPSLLVTQVIPPRENVVLQIAVVPTGPIAGGDASRAAQY